MKAVIVDDEAAMHLIVKRMLSKLEEVEVLGAFQETESAFSFLKSHPVDLVFIDIQMPRENGLDFAKRLRDWNTQMKLVFITSHKEYALSAFDVYAYDYIVKPLSRDRLLETVKRALSEDLLDKREKNSVKSLIEPLTKREKEVLQMIGDGLSNREIAEAFVLSEGTIKNHIVNIFGKLQVKNRVQAASVARMHKMIQ